MLHFSHRLCMNSHTTHSFDWGSLQSFLAVVRAGRLTVAARQLGVDHSTLSRRIQKLEKSLQARLFDRRAHGYALTPQGERLLDFAQRMESSALTAMTEVGSSLLSVAGNVRVGATDGFGTMFLAPRLIKLRDLHPGLDLQLVTLPRIFSLSKREADIAIGLSPPKEGRLYARKLTDYELGLFAAKDYLARHPPIRDRTSLRQHRFIGYIADLIYAPELDYVSLISRDLEASFASSNLIAQFHATVAGGGLCVLPYFMAVQDKRLRRILPGAVSLTRSFWLIVHSDMRDLARVRIVSEFIAQEVRNARSNFIPAKD
jgi:DNA-binding transcriptional LysR family regulator